jgi:hypothetical protein
MTYNPYNIKINKHKEEYMWQLYVFSVLAGLFGANGIPHFVKGISGEKHPTPFGRSSSAATNVVWGWLNFVVAGICLYWSHFHSHLLRAFALVMAGALIIGLILASAWSKHSQHNK